MRSKFKILTISIITLLVLVRLLLSLESDPSPTSSLLQATTKLYQNGAAKFETNYINGLKTGGLWSVIDHRIEDVRIKATENFILESAKFFGKTSGADQLEQHVEGSDIRCLFKDRKVLIQVYCFSNSGNCEESLTLRDSLEKALVNGSITNNLDSVANELSLNCRKSKEKNADNEIIKSIPSSENCEAKSGISLRFRSQPIDPWTDLTPSELF